MLFYNKMDAASGRCWLGAVVLGSCLQVFGIGHVVGRDRPCLCRRDGLEHVCFCQSMSLGAKLYGSSPLKIIGPWISMLLTRAEWTDIPWGIMNQSMPNHLILALEPLSARAPRAAFNRTIVRTILRMHVCMGTISDQQEFIIWIKS